MVRHDFEISTAHERIAAVKVHTEKGEISPNADVRMRPVRLAALWK
jgi:hypothetical protein